MAIHTGPFNGIAVCAGNGGLELGLKLALGDCYKTVCYVEREAYNARTLVARMEDAALGNAPIWDDIKTFDGLPWRGIVDIISAGFPCQPHSAAGLKKGTADERWIWNDIVRTVGEIRPEIIFLENVPDLAFSGLSTVVGTLSEAGYRSVWDTFSAEETGASQERERLFILSYRNSLFDRREQTEREAWRNIVSSSGRENFSELVFAGCDGKQKAIIREGFRESEQTIFEMEYGFSQRQPHRRQGEFSRRTESRQASRFIFPPFRNDEDEVWRSYLTERPDAQPAIRRSSDGLADRVDRITTIGNGVVPLVAPYSFISLMRTALQLR